VLSTASAIFSKSLYWLKILSQQLS